jgi:pyruvate dehydrogenase E2 component (dihydrolipoamide acetyltransferase)
MTDIAMPQLGETVTEGTITKWTKQVGDQVAEDEVLYEVSTDKVDSEVPSPVAGYLAEILVPEGDTVEVGTVLARISTEPVTGGGGGGDDAAEAPATTPSEVPEPAPEAEPSDEAEATPAAEAAQAAPPAPAPAPATASADEAEAPSEQSGPGALLSPVVRRLMSEHGLEASQITGTGVGGRITRADVQKVIDAGGAKAAPAAPAPAAAPAAPTAAATPSAASAARPAPLPAAAPGERDQVIPFSRIRKVTAEHMVMSKATSAHTLIAVEVDYHEVENVRAARKVAFKAEHGTSLTYLPFIARAVVDAIGEFPHVNSSVGNEELIVHRYLNLGIAVDLNFEGLLVPVVRDAHDKRLGALAREISDLAAKARSKRVMPDDLVGGTFTITNAGPFGTFLTAPVINQPQTAILSTDGVKKKPVVVELPDGGDAIVIHPVGVLALSFDHRAFDGAYAAAFVARVKEILETRDWASEL